MCAAPRNSFYHSSSKSSVKSKSLIHTWIACDFGDVDDSILYSPEIKPDELKIPESKLLHDRGGIAVVCTDMYVFSEIKLAAYLAKLKYVVLKSFEFPLKDYNKVAIQIDDGNRSIGLRFNLKDRVWEMFTKESKATERFSTEAQVAHRIVEFLSQNIYAGCNIRIFTPKINLKNILSDFVIMKNKARKKFLVNSMLKNVFVTKSNQSINLIDFAFQNENVNLVALLIKNKIISNSELNKIIVSAVKRNKLAFLVFLQKAAATFSKITKNGRNLADYAVTYGHLEVLKFLEKAGVDLHSKHEDNSSLFHIATFEEVRLDILRWLIEQDEYDPNQKTIAGNTAVHFILDAEKLCFGAIKCMGAHGADFTIVNDLGETAITKALKRRVFKSAAYMIEKSRGKVIRESDAALISFYRSELEEARTRLLQMENNLMLHSALSREHFSLKLTKQFAELGVDFTWKNWNNKSAIARAIDGCLFREAIFMIDHCHQMNMALSPEDISKIEKCKLELECSRVFHKHDRMEIVHEEEQLVLPEIVVQPAVETEREHVPSMPVVFPRLSL